MTAIPYSLPDPRSSTMTNHRQLFQNVPYSTDLDTDAQNNFPSENMIRSKTVRAEKRKQRDRRERPVEQLVENCQDQFNCLHMNQYAGQHMHPRAKFQPHSVANVNQYCYTNPASIYDEKPQIGVRPYNCTNVKMTCLSSGSLL